MKDHAKVVGLIRIASIVQENVRAPLSSCPWGYSNWLGSGIGCRKERRWIIIRRVDWTRVGCLILRFRLDTNLVIVQWMVITRWIVPKPMIVRGQ